MFGRRFGYKQAVAVFNSLRGKVASEKEAALIVRTTLEAVGVRMTFETEGHREIGYANTAIAQVQSDKTARVRELESKISSARDEIREIEAEIRSSELAVVNSVKNATSEIIRWTTKKTDVTDVLNFFRK